MEADLEVDAEQAILLYRPERALHLDFLASDERSSASRDLTFHRGDWLKMLSQRFFPRTFTVIALGCK